MTLGVDVAKLVRESERCLRELENSGASESESSTGRGCRR